MSIGRLAIRDVHLAKPGETVVAAARRMRDNRIGTLVDSGWTIGSRRSCPE